IREAAQTLLSGRERAALHREAARLLLAKLSVPERSARVLEIADHLMLAAAELGEAERIPALEIELQAGSLALRPGAAASASRYFGACLALFRDADWTVHPRLGLELFF